MSSYRLIETMKGLHQAAAGLRAVLPPAIPDPAVYYICPLSNLRRIAVTGVLPNAAAPRDRTDLSGQGVQVRREIPVNLTRWATHNAHQCINLFWNPINWTFRVFQRNAILCETRSHNPDQGVVCILEFNLERLLLGHNCNWTIAPQNFAAGNFTRFAQRFFTGEDRWPDGTPHCDWNSILSVAPTTDRGLNRKRSAELLVHIGAGGDSAPIPFAYVDQIFIPTAAIRELTDEQTAFLNGLRPRKTRVANVNGTETFSTQEELLSAERGFITTMGYRHQVDQEVLQKLNAAFTAIEQFESAHPDLSPRRESFDPAVQAYGYHGSLHASRVMFWSAFIVQHLGQPDRDRLLPIVLTAASLHDSRRQNNDEDEVHGGAAADAHRGPLSRFLTDPASLDSCLNAMRYHCIPDDRCPALDLAAQIVKDADALDRGRFGRPGDATGCNPALLRTPLLREQDPNRNIAWMAYWAARATRFAPFDSTPCLDFSNSLCTAINALCETPGQPAAAT